MKRTAPVNAAGEGIGDPGFAGEFKHMRAVKYREAPWAERYPELASLNDFISLPLIGNFPDVALLAAEQLFRRA